MHNIPTMVLGIVIAVAWRHELVGAVVFGLCAVLYTMMVVRAGHWQWSIMIAGPALSTSILYLLAWRARR
jgi:hypothetical protein